MLNTLLLLTYIIPLPFWVLMIFFPKRGLTQRVANNYTVFLLLGALYIFTAVGALVAWIAQAASGNAPTMGLFSVEGLGGLFSSPAGALVVWLHMTTMDLIGGHWMYHETQRLKTNRVLAALFLLTTYLLGPLGLFVFVMYRLLVSLREHNLAESKESKAETASKAA